MTTFRRPTAVIDLDVFAYLGARGVFRRELEVIRRDCVNLPARLTEALEELATEAEAEAARMKSKVSNEVSNVDGSGFTPVKWIPVKTAAEELGTSTQYVTRLLGDGSLHGDRPARRWLVCSESVEARKKGTKCPH
jgi:hypothetical protein